MSFYKYQSAIGGEKEKDILVFVCKIYYQIRGMACGGSDFFQSRYNVKNRRASSFYRCFSILRSHKRGIIHTRFHTFIWWKKTDMLKLF